MFLANAVNWRILGEPTVIAEGSVISYKGNKEYEVNKKLVDVVDINVLEYSKLDHCIIPSYNVPSFLD